MHAAIKFSSITSRYSAKRKCVGNCLVWRVDYGFESEVDQRLRNLYRICSIVSNDAARGEVMLRTDPASCQSFVGCVGQNCTAFRDALRRRVNLLQELVGGLVRRCQGCGVAQVCEVLERNIGEVPAALVSLGPAVTIGKRTSRVHRLEVARQITGEKMKGTTYRYRLLARTF